jgi:hypothetical protein
VDLAIDQGAQEGRGHLGLVCGWQSLTLLKSYLQRGPDRENSIKPKRVSEGLLVEFFEKDVRPIRGLAGSTELTAPVAKKKVLGSN